MSILSRGPTLPIQLETLDHYTLIVADAKASSDFHVDYLGFTLLRIQDVGTEDPTDFTRAMRNYVLSVPGGDMVTCVITEGLSEESIFTRFMHKYGAGIHHVAYAVDDIESSITVLRNNGVGFTSPRAVRDPIRGLKQIFIERSHAGYFIELIERTEGAPSGHYTNRNMGGLGNTMAQYVRDVPSATSNEMPSLEFPVDVDAIMNILGNPEHLPEWTCHRSVRKLDGQFVEIRLHGDVVISAETDKLGVTYRFARGSELRTTRFSVAQTGERRCLVTVELPTIAPTARGELHALLAAELRCLHDLIVGRRDDVPAMLDRDLILKQSEKVYSRREL